MKDARDLMGNLAQTNHYLVSFSSLKRTITNHLRLKFDVNDVDNYLSRKAGILCSEASLPSSSLATGEVRDNFMGIPQEFAHTRLYTDLDFTFYVDNDYTNLRVFEGWMDYITSGSEYFDRANELDDNYYRRVMYPDDYKVQTMRIIKFERNYKQQLEYQFINAFPKLITAIPVSYGQSDILKVNVTFNYDRYIVNPKGNYRAGPTNFTSLTSFVQQQKAQSLTSNNISNKSNSLNMPDSSSIFSQSQSQSIQKSSRPNIIPNSTHVGADDRHGIRTFPSSPNTVSRGSYSITPNAAANTGNFVKRDNMVYGTTFPAGSF